MKNRPTCLGCDRPIHGPARWLDRKRWPNIVYCRPCFYWADEDARQINDTFLTEFGPWDVLQNVERIQHTAFGMTYLGPESGE